MKSTSLYVHSCEIRIAESIYFCCLYFQTIIAEKFQIATFQDGSNIAYKGPYPTQTCPQCPVQDINLPNCSAGGFSLGFT